MPLNAPLDPQASPGSDTLRLADVAGLVIENAADAIFVMDTEGRTVFANAAAERTFGWTRDELRGRILHDVVHHHHPDGRPFPIAECPLGQVFTSRTPLQRHEDLFFHCDGRPIAVACSNAPVLRGGEMIGAVLVAVDITERKRAEEHQRLLLHELNHRVKNTLATVQSIVGQSLRAYGVPDPARAAIDDRLLAMARVHDILIREQWEGVDLADVVAGAVRPFAGPDDGRVVTEGPHVFLQPAKALSIAMAVQELGTNASKYGSLSQPGGRVLLHWTVEGVADGAQVRRLRLVWEEADGPPVVPPATRGFGTRLLERTLAYDLDGTVDLEFRPTGLVCTLDAPLG